MSARDLEESPGGAVPDDRIAPEVIAEELRYVRDRRVAAGSEGPAAGGDGAATEDQAAAEAADLVGLALSGGGIRSATFNLGLLQALERWGVFRHIDYLSTVSGGGFIGSALSALMSGPKNRGFPFGSAAPPGQPPDPGASAARPVVEHLRNNSNYLTPKGLLDVAQIVAVLARGILLNLVVLAPWMLLVCAIVTFFYGPQLWEQATNDSYFEEIDRHLSRHMDRDLDGDQAVAAVIRALDIEGLVRPEATAVESRVRAWLRGEHLLETRELDALMNSSGLEEVDDDFADGVTRTEVAKRLWQANLGEQRRGRPLLVSLMALDEIDVIVDDLALDWAPDDPEMVCRFATALRDMEWVGDLGDRERRVHLLYDPWLDERGIIDFLVRSNLVLLRPDQPPDATWQPDSVDREAVHPWDTAGAHYRFAEPDISQGRVLLELYAASFFSPLWFEAGSWYASNWSDASYYREQRLNDSLIRLLGRPEDPAANGVEGLLLALTSTAGPLRPGVTGDEVVGALLDSGLVQPAIGRGRFQFTLDPDVRPAPDDPVYPRRAASRRSLVLSESLVALFEAGLLRQELTADPILGEALATAAERSEIAWARRRGEQANPPEAALAEVASEPSAWTAAERASRAEALRSLGQELGAESATEQWPLLARLRERGLLVPGAPDDEELLNLVELVRWSSQIDGSLAGAACDAPLPELFSDGMIWSGRTVPDPVSDAPQGTGRVLAALYDLGLLRGGPAPLPQLDELVCVGRRVGRVALEVSVVEWALRASGLEEPLTVAGLLEALAGVEGLLRPRSIDLNLVRELYDRKVVGLGDTHQSYRLVNPDRALSEYLLVLYEGRHFRQAWFEEIMREEVAYREGEGLRTHLLAMDPFYIDYLRRFEGLRTWTAESFRLPATGGLVKLALWWTLAFPLVILLGKLLARRRPGAPRPPPSPARRLGRRLRDGYERSFAVLVIAILAFAFIEVQPYVVYRYHWARVHGETDWSLLLGAISLIAAVAGGPALAFLERFGQRIALVVVALLGPLLPYLVFLWAMDQITFGVDIDEFAKNVQLIGPLAVYLALVFLALALGIWLLSLLLDVNRSAFHGFYRDRLARAYLLRRAADAVEPADELRLSEICPPGSAAPYHLINAALNLQASGDESLRDRASDFFLFSRLFTGGQRTGYCRTGELEKIAPGLGLAGAMAVSGAAVTPNMGVYSSGGLAPLMALLNIRLGLWVPHPRQVREIGAKSLWRRMWLRLRLQPGPGRLLREIRSDIDDAGALVYLSDGGHLENTGAFELLRRRCRLIVIGDGEADPGHSFPALAALMRYARIDLDTEIEIDLGPLRVGPDGTCGQHFAIGRIRYPATASRPAAEGVLVYVKSSVTGAEDEVVTEYRARNPLFPHESTADQFFNENQFEAYRDLGSHAVETLFEQLGGPVESRAQLLDSLERRAGAPAGS